MGSSSVHPPSYGATSNYDGIFNWMMPPNHLIDKVSYFPLLNLLLAPIHPSIWIHYRWLPLLPPRFFDTTQYVQKYITGHCRVAIHDSKQFSRNVRQREDQSAGWQSIRMHWDPLLAPFATPLLLNGNPVILSPAPPNTLRLRYHYFISSLLILSLAQPSTLHCSCSTFDL